MLTESDRKLRRLLAAIVVVHAAVALWHGSAHVHVPVPLTPLQSGFVAVVILLAPFVGAGLLWTSRKLTGAWVIAISMLASLLFGAINHFVLHSPDNVAEVPEHAWRHAFVLSAVLVAVTEAIGTAIGAFAVRKWSEVPSGD
jgi:hypothetical protein